VVQDFCQEGESAEKAERGQCGGGALPAVGAGLGANFDVPADLLANEAI